LGRARLQPRCPEPIETWASALRVAAPAKVTILFMKVRDIIKVIGTLKEK
jgi:hypothetical protein